MRALLVWEIFSVKWEVMFDYIGMLKQDLKEICYY